MKNGGEKMQQYQFEKIYSQMEREFGKIKKGEEEAHSLILFTMESNALKIHRSDLKANSRRMREAIAYQGFHRLYKSKPFRIFLGGLFNRKIRLIE